ncbi:MAG: restriction endonuclease [Verrucomicrobiia bacterium]|jgi:restriction system protein
MPIPEFNEIKAPALQFFTDGAPHKVSEVYTTLASHFKLTEEEQNEILPSGVQRRWHNRANWACYDLFRAGLLDRPKRGLYIITDAGKQLAAQKPQFIDRDFLMKFPQFVQFAKSTGTKKANHKGEQYTEPESASTDKSKTPEELIDAAYQMLDAALKHELLDLAKKMDPLRFEQLVLDLLVAMGYGGSREEAAKVTKASNDEGIDGLINEDRLGLDVIYVQAKRWKDTVGRKEIQSFVGALAGQQAHKGVFITTSDFADTAIAYAKKVPQKVILIDGDRLADLMIQHNIGVSKSHSYDVKHVDSDYFEQD